MGLSGSMWFVLCSAPKGALVKGLPGESDSQVRPRRTKRDRPRKGEDASGMCRNAEWEGTEGNSPRCFGVARCSHVGFGRKSAGKGQSWDMAMP